MDSGFKHWVNNDINTYCSITKKKTLQSFQVLGEKYNLEKHEFFRRVRQLQNLME